MTRLLQLALTATRAALAETSLQPWHIPLTVPIPAGQFTMVRAYVRS
jgi:hypothetical protein